MIEVSHWQRRTVNPTMQWSEVVNAAPIGLMAACDRLCTLHCALLCIRLYTTSWMTGVQVLAGIVAAPYLLIGLAFLKGWLPLLCLGLSGISLPFGAKLLKYASKHRASPEMIRPLKKYAIKWHTVLGCFLALGIVLDARMSGKLLAFF
jgi:hypothetical protein